MTGLLPSGTVAPDFESTDQDGRPVRLGDFAGRPVVLYFYPEDDTPGCTREACSFRDSLGEFTARGAIVLGVSTQDAASHRAFRDRYGLKFPLLADPEKKITRAYNALGILGVAKRVTYVVGPDGRIVDAFRRLDPKRHSREALRVLDALTGGNR